MDPLLIIKLLTMGASLISEGANAYSQIKGTLSETDAAKIKQALIDAQAVTAQMRPIVDEALAEASKS